MKTRNSLLVTALALATFTMSARGAVDFFLKIDGIQGESIFTGHVNEIDVQSFSWGMSQGGVKFAGQTGSPAKSNFNTMTFFKTIDKASPVLMLACALGTIPGIASPTATVSFFDDSRKVNQEFFQIVLSNVAVADLTEGVAQGSSGGDAPVESVSLNFTKIEFKYTPDAQGAAVIHAGYDVKANKGL